MADDTVTAVELARRVGDRPPTLRQWLRDMADAGHPLLAGRVRYERWIFSRAGADRLAAEYLQRRS